MIGDSHVEARQVPIADKFHVRLEELAAEELRHLDITTSAFGIWGTGQVNQLAYYEFARTLRPALDFTAFALDQFRERADRDGAALVILSSHYIGTRGDLGFDRLTALAKPRGIPVIDYNDFVLRQGAEPRRDARWKHDAHWNTAGHRWAAEALLEYLKENQEICTRRKSPTSPPPLPSWRKDYESIASGEQGR